MITTFKSISRAYVDLRIDLPWEEIAELLITHNDVAEKKDAELFNMARFKTTDDPTHEPGRKRHYINGVSQSTYDLIPNTVRRCSENVISIDGIILDVDEKMSIDDLIKKLPEEMEYVLYTTFRHTPEHHKFRVVIPFSEPLIAEDIAGRQESIMEYFPGVDNCSFTQSQSFYFHSGKTEPIAFRNKGTMIKPYDFEYREQPVWVPKEVVPRADSDFSEWEKAVTRSLQSCSGLHYDGVNGSQKGVLVLVQICKSIGMSFAEFDNICQNISDPKSNLKRPEVRNMAWTGWDRDRATRSLVDSFLKDYNGRPLIIVRPGYGQLSGRKILQRDPK